MASRCRAALVLAVAILGFPACLSPASPPPGPDSPPSWEPGPAAPAPTEDLCAGVAAVHDHSDPAQHEAHHGLELVGHVGIAADGEPGQFDGANVEVSLSGPWAFLSNWGPQRGLTIVNISDPAAPRRVADFTPAGHSGPFRAGTGSYWDVGAFPGGDLVVLSAQALASSQSDDAGLGAAATERLGGGLFLINTSDKTKPFEESFTPFLDQDALIPVGVHNAHPFVAGNGTYVAATTANGATYILELVGDAPHRVLRLVSKVPGVHDTAVQTHPVTGDLLLYGAQGGVVITNVTDPAKPEVIATLPNGPDLTAYHQVIPNNVLVEGRHYTVATTEDTDGAPTPFTILDTTDPYDPKVVGRWILPCDVAGNGQPYRFSGHNVDFIDGRLVIGHYHAGVWIVDVSTTERAADPVALAFYQPHERGENVPRTLMGVDAPMVWTALVHDDGLIWASDVNSGLYALRSTASPSPYEGAPQKWPTNLH